MQGTAQELRLRGAARRAGLRLSVRSMPIRRPLTVVSRGIDPYGTHYRRPRYWLVRLDGSKIGGPDGMSLDELENVLSPGQVHKGG